MKPVVVIPARLNSSRLPGKVLLDIRGKSMLQRVYEQARKADNIAAVYIATDSRKIAEHCRSFAKNIVMTSSYHQSGTDRLAEAVGKIECDVVVNVQGDEPFVDPALISRIAEVVSNGTCAVGSAMRQFERGEEIRNPNRVKVVVDNMDKALYFSRSLIPYLRDQTEKEGSSAQKGGDCTYWQHIGIYGYRKHFLESYTSMEAGTLEMAEKLEQLRILENGHCIQMIRTEHDAFGIDTKEDYQRAIQMIEENV